MKDMIESCENELHQNVSISREQAVRERDYFIEKHLTEDVSGRCQRLAYEEEFLRGNTKMAEAYLLEDLKN